MCHYCRSVQKANVALKEANVALKLAITERDQVIKDLLKPGPTLPTCPLCGKPAKGAIGTKYFREGEFPDIPAGDYAVCATCETWALRGWDRDRRR